MYISFLNYVTLNTQSIFIITTQIIDIYFTEYITQSSKRWFHAIEKCRMKFFRTKFNCMRHSCSLNRMLRYWRNVPDRARSHESIGRRLHQRPASPKSHSLENRRNGSGWGASLRDIAATPRFSRLRIENFEPLPGNRFHQAGRDRRQQAEGSHPWDRGEDRRNEEGQPWDLLVGDQGKIGEGKRWLI